MASLNAGGIRDMRLLNLDHAFCVVVVFQYDHLVHIFNNGPESHGGTSPSAFTHHSYSPMDTPHNWFQLISNGPHMSYLLRRRLPVGLFQHYMSHARFYESIALRFFILRDSVVIKRFETSPSSS